MVVFACTCNVVVGLGLGWIVFGRIGWCSIRWNCVRRALMLVGSVWLEWLACYLSCLHWIGLGFVVSDSIGLDLARCDSIMLGIVRLPVVVNGLVGIDWNSSGWLECVACVLCCCVLAGLCLV